MTKSWHEVQNYMIKAHGLTWKPYLFKYQNILDTSRSKKNYMKKNCQLGACN
jgi:hypothetical protein